MFNLFLKIIESFSSFMGKIDRAIMKGFLDSSSGERIEYNELGSKKNPIHFVVDSKKDNSIDKK